MAVFLNSSHNSLCNMVIEIAYGRDDTLMEAQESFEVLEGYTYIRQDYSFISNTCRDTSTSPREVSDDLRQSVNTHDSILNMNSDDEDSDDNDDNDGDDDDNNYLFDFQDPMNQSIDDPPQTKQQQQQQLVYCTALPSNPVTDWLESSKDSFKHVTESFVDVLCFSEPWGETNQQPYFLQDQVNLDLVAMLGCMENPTKDELQAWTTLQQRIPPTKKRACKRSIRSRAAAIRRIRQERTRLNPAGLVKVKSMDDSLYHGVHHQEQNLSIQSALGITFFGDEDLDQLIGNGMDAIATVDDDIEYDSDPELLTDATNSTNNCVPVTAAPSAAVGPMCEHDDSVLSETVEHTLNYTCSLMNHTEQKSTPVELWLERGSILNGGHLIIEPKFMWREVFQGNLGIRKLNESCQKPFGFRMLNVCRILPFFDKRKYPLAHPHKCLLLRTCFQEEYLFEASTTEERDAIIARWKVVIARLATLAVTEDMKTMGEEFFLPGPLLVNNQSW